MNRLLTALIILLGLTFTLPVKAQGGNDEQMINASLRFIKENANLTKREYQKFAKLYIEYNEELADLNRELKPDSRDYLKRWSSINDNYMKGLEKALPDSTRKKISVAQWELGQKIWNQWDSQNRQNVERQFQVMGQWNQMNPQFMMRPNMFDFTRMHQSRMRHANEQQQQWWENYWRNWGHPDSTMFRRLEENRRMFMGEDSIRQQHRLPFTPQFGPQFGPQVGPQFGPQFGPWPTPQPTPQPAPQSFNH